MPPTRPIRALLAKIWDAAPVLLATLAEELAEPLVLEEPLLPVAVPEADEPERVDEPEAEADEDPLVEVETLAPAVPLV